MTNTKIMDFTAFSKATPLQEPKNALKGDNVTPSKKESFVDQVKHSDLTTMTTNKPDYSNVERVDENEQASALVSEITAIERQIVDLQTALQTKKEALQTVVNTTTTTTLAPTSGTQPAAQPIATATPGTTPIAPALPAATPAV
jgi:hypothetical protein